MMDINVERETVKNNELTFILRRCWKNFEKSAFLEDSLLHYQDVHSKARIFDKILMETLDRHASIKMIKIRKFHKKGLSQAALDLIKEREKAREN